MTRLNARLLFFIHHIILNYIFQRIMEDLLDEEFYSIQEAIA